MFVHETHKHYSNNGSYILHIIFEASYNSRYIMQREEVGSALPRFIFNTIVVRRRAPGAEPTAAVWKSIGFASDGAARSVPLATALYTRYIKQDNSAQLLLFVITTAALIITEALNY